VKTPDRTMPLMLLPVSSHRGRARPRRRQLRNTSIRCFFSLAHTEKKSKLVLIFNVIFNGHCRFFARPIVDDALARSLRHNRACTPSAKGRTKALANNSSRGSAPLPSSYCNIPTTISRDVNDILKYFGRFLRNVGPCGLPGSRCFPLDDHRSRGF